MISVIATCVSRCRSDCRTEFLQKPTKMAQQERVMRQTLTGMVAAIGLMTAGAAPAMACGWGGCLPCGGYAPCYTYAPAYTYSGCGTCGGWGFARLAAPTTQYYYVNQGPTYTGPGAF